MSLAASLKSTLTRATEVREVMFIFFAGKRSVGKTHAAFANDVHIEHPMISCHTQPFPGYISATRLSQSVGDIPIRFVNTRVKAVELA
jgi:hypothetical protein